MVLLHGIRTEAAWQEMVAASFQRIPGVETIPIRYGYFDVLRFILPIGTRQRPIDRVERELRAIRDIHPSADMSVVAHSFGTYAICTILDEHPEIRLHRLILCASIVPRDFRWDKAKDQVREKVLNDCGTEDIWPVLAQSLTWGYGASGTFGFGTAKVRDRFHQFSHSQYFDAAFVEQYWSPYIATGKIVAPKWESQRRTPPGWFSWLALIPLKWGIVTLLGLGAALPAIRLILRPPSTPEVDVTLYQPGLEDTTGQVRADSKPGFHQASDVTVRNEYDSSGGDIPSAPSEFTLNYTYDRVENRIHIQPQMPYLSLLSEGGLATAQEPWMRFRWQFPQLSIKILNNTPHTLLLSELVIAIRSSQINREPVLVFRKDLWELEILNEGWGKVLDPILSFGITDVEACDTARTLTAVRHTLEIGAFYEGTRISVDKYLSTADPRLLRSSRSRFTCMFGTLQYVTETNERRAVSFRGKMGLIGFLIIPLPPSYRYDVLLPAGRAGYSIRIPLSYKIEPDDAEHFLVRMATDKSGEFDLDLSYRSVDGTEWRRNSVLIDVFVPRSQASYARPNR